MRERGKSAAPGETMGRMSASAPALPAWGEAYVGGRCCVWAGRRRDRQRDSESISHSPLFLSFLPFLLERGILLKISDLS